MDLSELIARFRVLSGDHGVPPLWDDEEVTRLLNEAEREAAERARLLIDDESVEVTQIALMPGVRRYRLHPKVFDVESASIQRANALHGERKPLCRSDAATMGDLIARRPNFSGWADTFVVRGQPSGDGFEGMFIELDRKPMEAGGILFLSTYRYPLADMEAPTDEPEIPPRDHDALVHWALATAYSTRDMEGSASQRAVTHEAEFIKRFGERDDANVRRKKVRHRAPVTRPLRW